jgi:hypothetical protein
MTMSKPYFVPLLAICLVLALSSAAWACPGCKEALANSEGGGGDLRAGFFWSILFMLSMPFLILGGLCTAMYLAVRRARVAEAAGRPTVVASASAASSVAAANRDGAGSAAIGTAG